MIAIDVHALRKSYGVGPRAPRHRSVHRGQRTARRPARAQRRRQDHARRDSRRAARCPRPGRCRCWASIPRTRVRPRCARASACSCRPRRSCRSSPSLETLRLYGALYPKIAARRATCSQRVDLDDKAKALVRTLSGGQKQRLALAMAMLHDPDLYILDEPTSGLDPIARRQIHDILQALKRDGKTVLISSHYLDEIEALADRVVILSAGEIVADGTPLELLGARAPAHRRSGWRSRAASMPARLVPERHVRRSRRRALPLPHRRPDRGDRRPGRVASRVRRAARRPAPEAAVARGRLPAARRHRRPGRV